MKKQIKILIAGVGGQGVVYLTNLLVEAALLSDMPVATSEIHGLSQRGGSVTAGITLGENTYGFIEKAGADFLLGLEPLEAQRCLPYLHNNSKAVIGNNKIFPYAVNAGQAEYPDTSAFVNYLQKNIKQVIFIDEMDKKIAPLLINIYVLGNATQMDDFPLESKYIEQAIATNARKGFIEKSLEAFRLGTKTGENYSPPIQKTITE